MRFKRVVSLLACGVLLLTLAAVRPTLSAEAKTVAEYQSALDAAKAEANAVKAQIAALKKKNAPYEQQRAALEAQVDAVQKEIRLYEAQIAQCKATIDERTRELEETRETLKQRLVALYTSGNSTQLSLLLSAEDYGDYLAKSELSASLSRHDTAVITGALNAIAELELAKSELDKSQQEIQGKKAELVSALDEVKKIVSANNRQVNALNQDLAQLQAEQKEIEAAIKKAQQSSGSGSGGSAIKGTGQFIWPVPGCYKVSSGFGSRWGRSHTGIDIISSSGGVTGKPIVAADSGTVILSKYYSGYGNCIMINHGNGYVTLYGHMRYLSSYGVGASVTKGQTIGYVGATGNVTGPHLHFEIRLNGTCKNPMNYYN